MARKVDIGDRLDSGCYEYVHFSDIVFIDTLTRWIF
jgi:hypothetical protein